VQYDLPYRLRVGLLVRTKQRDSALIDRLVHHCHSTNIRGNSYRMRDHAEIRQALYPPPDDRPVKRAPHRPEAIST